jgi:hypothetical protein
MGTRRKTWLRIHKIKGEREVYERTCILFKTQKCDGVLSHSTIFVHIIYSLIEHRSGGQTHLYRPWWRWHY